MAASTRSLEAFPRAVRSGWSVDLTLLLWRAAALAAPFASFGAALALLRLGAATLAAASRPVLPGEEDVLLHFIPFARAGLVGAGGTLVLAVGAGLLALAPLLGAWTWRAATRWRRGEDEAVERGMVVLGLAAAVGLAPVVLITNGTHLWVWGLVGLVPVAALVGLALLSPLEAPPPRAPASLPPLVQLRPPAPHYPCVGCGRRFLPREGAPALVCLACEPIGRLN